jgi:hypothetical protein
VYRFLDPAFLAGNAANDVVSRLSSGPPAPLPEQPDAPNGLIAEPLPELVRELAARYDLQATTRRQAQAKKPLIRDKSRQHIKAG